MVMMNKTAWMEGMLLQAQHFQQQDRYMEHLIHQNTIAINIHAWGFLELTLDTNLLSIGQLGIQSAHGFFEDGTLFNIPEDTRTPSPIAIPEGLNKTLVYLAIPFRGNKARTKNTLHKLMDIHTENTKEIHLSILQLELCLEKDNKSGHLYLPIAEIEESRSHHHINLSKDFLYPTLNIQHLLPLQKFMHECHCLIQHRASMLSDRLTDTQQAGTAEVIDFMLLQILNKYEPWLHHLSHKNPLHPENLFEVLIQMMGEMATFTNNRRRPIEAPIYEHLDLRQTFKTLMKELRHALSIVLEQNATAIKLTPQTGGLWTGQIVEKELLKNSEFILAIYADIPAEHLRSQMNTQLKIAPVEHIRNLISRALPGIEISPMAIAPRQIPYHANFSYFSLNQKNLLWSQLSNSAGIALHASTPIPGLKFELWALKG